MNLAIVGYGKMGRRIECLAPDYGFTVALKIGRDDGAADRFTNSEFSRNRRGGGIFHPCGMRRKRRAPGGARREHRGGHDGLARSHRPRAQRGAAERHRAGVGTEFFSGREHFHGNRRNRSPPHGRRTRLRRVGLGNSSRHKKGCDIRNAANACFAKSRKMAIRGR